MKLNDFGEILRQWRVSKMLSLNDLAGISKYDKAVLSKMENNKHGITIVDLDAIVRSAGDEPESLVIKYLRGRYPKFDQSVLELD